MMAPTPAAEKSDATKRAYRSAFLHFTGWCNSTGREPLPASVETVVTYLASLGDSGLKSSTIRKHCAAIAYAHEIKGIEPPTMDAQVRAILRRARRREICG